MRTDVGFCSGFLRKGPTTFSPVTLLPSSGGTTRLDGRYKFSLVCLGGSLRVHMPETPPRGDVRMASEPNAQSYSADSS